jgi:hypothetical protein
MKRPSRALWLAIGNNRVEVCKYIVDEDDGIGKAAVTRVRLLLALSRQPDRPVR